MKKIVKTGQTTAGEARYMNGGKSMSETDVRSYIAGLIEKARAAQKVAEGFTQEQVDRLAGAVCYEIYHNKELIRELAEFAMEETELGDVPSKIGKVTGKCRAMWHDVKNVKTVGITEEIPEKGLVRISKPVGVIGSLVPSTQPEMHPIVQTVNALKARDAIIFAPHPRGKKTSVKTVDIIRGIIKKYGAPEDLVICIPEPTVEITNELMAQSDLVIATGGQGMVRAAYSSGRPAFGVGAGNANIVIDSTANLAEAAAKIKNSKTFDLAAGCSCDNAVSMSIREDAGRICEGWRAHGKCGGQGKAETYHLAGMAGQPRNQQRRCCKAGTLYRGACGNSGSGGYLHTSCRGKRFWGSVSVQRRKNVCDDCCL